MEVLATKTGFYGGSLKNKGDAFLLKDKAHFSSAWMEETPPKPKPKKAPTKKPASKKAD